MSCPEFSDLHGKTLIAVKQDGDDEIVFVCADGKSYKLFHSQDCCESVFVESIAGELSDLIGSPILLAEEATSAVDPPDAQAPAFRDDSQTWTFYKLRTLKGSVDIRWYGSSNGYYSEGVDFVEVAHGPLTKK